MNKIQENKIICPNCKMETYSVWDYITYNYCGVCGKSFSEVLPVRSRSEIRRENIDKYGTPEDI